jgi:hypothetical protein
LVRSTWQCCSTTSGAPALLLMKSKAWSITLTEESYSSPRHTWHLNQMMLERVILDEMCRVVPPSSLPLPLPSSSLLPLPSSSLLSLSCGTGTFFFVAGIPTCIFLELCVYIYMLKVFLLPRSLFLNCSLPLYTVGSESNEPQLTKHKISSQKK